MAGKGSVGLLLLTMTTMTGGDVDFSALTNSKGRKWQ